MALADSDTGAPDAAFLGIERSLTGKRWEIDAAPERAVRALAQRCDLPDAAARVMAARGLGPDTAPAFLDPKLRAALPDPSHLIDMDKAVVRLVQAVREGEGIAIFGDYDVDGATSTAILTRYLRALGIDPLIHIPDRLKEGYGPNADALHRLAGKGAAVVLTVDCGITAFDALDAGAAAGLDIIVVDHHAAEPRLPRAHAIVNPNRLDETSPHGNLAAVGVSYLLLIALNRALRAAGWFERRREPDLIGLLDLVALGTVADVVPLTGLNRALVAQGLKVLAARRNTGLKALADVARLDEAPGAYHLGFLLGPRVNAGGRVGEPGAGAALLACDDPGQAAGLAAKLDAWNDRRRDMEAACLDEAVARVEADGAGRNLVFVSGADWHAGVIGIVAARLKERYDRPACVVAHGPDGGGKGSGRSVTGVDLGAAVIAARQAGLLLNGGGHRMAAGFTVDPAREADLAAFLEARIADQVGGAGGLVARLKLAGAVGASGATLDLVRALERLAPFGAGNPEPRFAVTRARIVKADIVGADHVRLILEGGLKAIAFRAADGPLGQALLSAAGGGALHLAGKLRLDRWNGAERVQLIVEDAADVRA